MLQKKKIIIIVISIYPTHMSSVNAPRVHVFLHHSHVFDVITEKSVYDTKNLIVTQKPIDFSLSWKCFKAKML